MLAETKARPFSRVQEIIVYVSVCITELSKLSVFWGSVSKGAGCCSSSSIQAVAYHCLTVLLPLLRRKLLISSLFCSGAAAWVDLLMLRMFDVHTGRFCADPTNDLPSASWSSSSDTSPRFLLRQNDLSSSPKQIWSEFTYRAV